VRWFTDRGCFAVMLVRRGYRQTGGAMAEMDTNCAEGPRNYARRARETARDIEAAVMYATSLRYARPIHSVVVGQSVGGLGAIASAATQPRRVSAIVNFAGGAGGHAGNLANNNCQPDQLAVAAGTFGASATTPMLWVYTGNDSYFSPPIALAMWQAFTHAGGKAELHQLGP
jgi:dienelactone hydrolase